MVTNLPVESVISKWAGFFCLHRQPRGGEGSTAQRRGHPGNWEVRIDGNHTKRNMREDISETPNYPAVEVSSFYDGSQVERAQSPETLRRSTMLTHTSRTNRASSRKQRSIPLNTRTALISILAIAPGTMAQNCISLSGSTECPAFSNASISTDSTLAGYLYVIASSQHLPKLIVNSPFLQYVSSTSTFDQQLSSYVQTSYVAEK